MRMERVHGSAHGSLLEQTAPVVGPAPDRRSYAFACTIGDVYDHVADVNPEGDLVFPDERCTYRELAQRIEMMARSLRALGLGPGDAVGLLLAPGLDNFAALGATAKLGAVSVPINLRFRTRELLHVIADGDLRVILSSGPIPGYSDYPGMLRASFPSLDTVTDATVDLSLDEAPALRRLIMVDEGEERGFMSRAAFDALAASVEPEEIDRLAEAVPVRSTATIMYTSGTESNPKGCLLSHEALVRTGVSIARTRFDLTVEDRMWNPLPMFHCGGIVLSLACFTAGTSFVHAGFFDPAVSIRQMEQERCTIAHPAFETIWLAVLNHPDFAAADLSRIRLIVNVGIPERMWAMYERFPQAVVFSSFGATEASSHLGLTLPDDDLEHRLRCGGAPLPGMEVRVVDPETGVDLPPDTEGEVLYRGPDAFDGYYKADALNAECIDGDGWFHSKDVGVMDDGGRLTFRSRLKDMLKVGGENVSAAEIEGVIAELSDVVIVQVVSAPDRRYIEVAAAFVQLRPGSTLTERDIIDACVGRIANFKVPRYVRFVTEWPMSGTKIRKTDLRQTIEQELTADGISDAPPLTARSGG
jgi:fatty-acyl-CoA synthase